MLLIDNNLMAIDIEESNGYEKTELLKVSKDIIRARTLSILRQFRTIQNAKASVIRFLMEANVVTGLEISLVDTT